MAEILQKKSVLRGVNNSEEPWRILFREFVLKRAEKPDSSRHKKKKKKRKRKFVLKRPRRPTREDTRKRTEREERGKDKNKTKTEVRGPPFDRSRDLSRTVGSRHPYGAA